MQCLKSESDLPKLFAKVFTECFGHCQEVYDTKCGQKVASFEFPGPRPAWE